MASSTTKPTAGLAADRPGSTSAEFDRLPEGISAPLKYELSKAERNALEREAVSTLQMLFVSSVAYYTTQYHRRDAS